MTSGAAASGSGSGSGWEVVTGEYPPEPGGVADYSAVVARALADAGQSVRVWCGGDAAGPAAEAGGVAVHRVAGRFGRRGLARLDAALGATPGPRRLLVQYVPHAFGLRSANVPFVAWVARRAALGDEVRVMFHEVAQPWVARPLRHNALAAAHRLMAAVLLRACARAYVSIPAWTPLLRRLGPRRLPVEWAPVPSNVPGVGPAPAGPRRAGGGPVVGHFGNYSPAITRTLGPALGALLDGDPALRVVLIGAAGPRWAPELVAGRPGRLGRVDAPGPLDAPAVAGRLRACDLLVQPYPDGVSSRRTTVMAALANAVPVATTAGPLSEPIWAGGAVALAPAGDAAALAAAAAGLLADPARRAELGRAGRGLYAGRFAVEHTVAALLGAAGPGPRPTDPTRETR